jgi:hypothetical protein
MRAELAPSRCPAVDAVVFGLSVFRFSRLIGQDDLPPIKRLRDRAIARWREQRPALVEAVECPWCSSVYIAAALLMLSRYRWARRALWIPAASAVAGLLATADSALGELAEPRDRAEHEAALDARIAHPSWPARA